MAAVLFPLVSHCLFSPVCDPACLYPALCLSLWVGGRGYLRAGGSQVGIISTNHLPFPPKYKKTSLRFTRRQIASVS